NKLSHFGHTGCMWSTDGREAESQPGDASETRCDLSTTGAALQTQLRCRSSASSHAHAPPPDKISRAAAIGSCPKASHLQAATCCSEGVLHWTPKTSGQRQDC